MVEGEKPIDFYRRNEMKRRDLTEIIGRRDGRALSNALSSHWDWNRCERQEGSAITTAERNRRRARRLAKLGLRLAN
jgi:hypothetical protein